MTTREAELGAQGWQKKSTVDEPRLSELVQTYRRIGCAVHLEPFDPREQPGCNDCMKSDPDRYKTIYIRKTGIDKVEDDEPR